MRATFFSEGHEICERKRDRGKNFFKGKMFSLVKGRSVSQFQCPKETVIKLN